MVYVINHDGKPLMPCKPVIARYLGKEYFIKGRMSTGYAILMDIEGNKINLKPIPKFNKMERISARKSWIMTYAFISHLQKWECSARF